MLFLRARPLLPLLLEEIARFRGDVNSIPIVDCGVFMGNFTIAAALLAEHAELELSITAYEANPALLEPIRANLALYNVSAKVHCAGIGGAYGVLNFVHKADGLIGGTLFKPDSKRGIEGYVANECEVIPLAAVLDPSMGLGIVKIDIEGNEVAAFNSIAADAGRLSNVFIIEYAPWQGKQAVGNQTYNEFLLQHFDLFDVNNWLWVPSLQAISNAAALEQCMVANKTRTHNTDLVLVPKEMTTLSMRLEILSSSI
ncbi:MAG: FkbM family methyltransferase [Maricaulaceae bacterium]|nr:FkbM family methyltransferase [Maricaulaceae bacterium]